MVKKESTTHISSRLKLAETVDITEGMFRGTKKALGFLLKLPIG